MNRAERRRNQKKQGKKEPIYNISEQELNKIKQNEREKAVNDAIILLMSLPIKVLKKHYGWGNIKRLPEFAEHLCDEYQEFVDGGRDLTSEVEFIYDMTGIKFQRTPD
jgi:hypothetical protein